MVLTEERESSGTTVAHWLVKSRYGFKFMKWQCGRCKVWVEGPVFVEEDGVQFFGDLFG